MAATPKRGAVAPPQSGVYKDPSSDGVKENTGAGAYRPPVDGVRDISEINYIPYGGVYEREGNNPADWVATGGVFEQYTAPDTEQFFVLLMSSPYPPLIVDSTTVDSFIIAGALFSRALDEMDVDSFITSGTLSALLISYTIPSESIDVDSFIVSGTLPVSLLTYTIPVEDIDVDSFISSGTLPVVLITYSNWLDEDLDVDSLITGGILV